ncbi:MAG: glycerol-3-phosphate 1-O-acyltransferase PlsY [Gammaproteobacteria bacterium]|nr:MAG: glycerol-3-phosphate 1-O-acyltransferase PlsY [Gammaproteobacteria bacterium]
MHQWLYLLPILAYLMGSVSSAIVLARILGLQDPRKVGSGNPGATNILRYGGKKVAALTLLGDIIKGVIPVVITRALTDDVTILALTALAAFLGHLYPVYFRFQGGKGVATALGVWSALNPWMGLALIATWVATAVITRFSSLSALVASFLAPVYAWWLLPHLPYKVMATVMAVLLIWRHRSNIKRLLAGEEGRIGK